MRLAMRRCLGLRFQDKCFLLLLFSILFFFISVPYLFSDFTSKLVWNTSQINSNFFNTYFPDPMANLTQGPREGYLVWNPSCRIPDIDPWHNSVRQLISRTEPVVCSSLPPLTQKDGFPAYFHHDERDFLGYQLRGQWIGKRGLHGLRTLQQWTFLWGHIKSIIHKIPVENFEDMRNNMITGRTLRLVQDNVLLYAPDNYLQCCYMEITRQDATDFFDKIDDIYSLSHCYPLYDYVNLTSEQQFFMVRCTAPRIWGDQDVYTNFHATVPVRKNLLKKLHKNKSPGRQNMSILIIGIDSISRLNLLRKMPKTVNYLRNSGWVEMKGYNKIDDNTFPNIMGILTGFNYTEVRKTCLKKLMKPIDSCPFIWKNYSRKGYITGYGEDSPTLGTFNFQKAGFFKTPTDYYLRPFMLAAETYSKVRKTDGMKACLGPTLATDHIFKYATDFTTTFSKNLFFSIFWMNTLSHNNVNTVSAMDIQTFNFLQGLSQNGILNNTLVVFLSDHGTRFGKIRETYVGWLEERLPFLFLWMPKWYRKYHPQKYINLLDNRDKLTSPFDLHLLLQEVLNGEQHNGTPSCPRCMSMFADLPWNRSCADVGVREHWCTCSEYHELSTEEHVVQAMVEFILNNVNTILQQGKNYTKKDTSCAVLNVKRILTVRTKVSTSSENYVVLFETLPGQALLEATLSYSEKFELLGTVSRINSYGSQSKCMSDPFLKKYCFCIKAN